MVQSLMPVEGAGGRAGPRTQVLGISEDMVSATGEEMNADCISCHRRVDLRSDTKPVVKGRGWGERP